MSKTGNWIIQHGHPADGIEVAVLGEEMLYEQPPPRHTALVTLLLVGLFALGIAVGVWL